MRASQIDPTISAYKALNGPYDWNWYPLAPLQCKAVIYEDSNIWGSWASRGVDGWYLRPSRDHYRCALYYIPETRAYRISGSTEVYPQNCQLPNLTNIQHLRALTDKLAEETKIAAQIPQGRVCIKNRQSNITKILNPSVANNKEQRVRRIEQERQQRVINKKTITTIPRITDTFPIMQSRNPTAKRHLKNTPWTHQRQTRNNTPGAVLLITRIKEPVIQNVVYAHDQMDSILAASMTWMPKVPWARNARHNFISTQAINTLTTREQCTPNEAFRQQALGPRPSTVTPNLQHYANPMVHPVTGNIISRYKKAIKDPSIAKLWKTDFGKEFGGLA